MKRVRTTFMVGLVCWLGLVGSVWAGVAVSGKLENGFRVLTPYKALDFKVFRGDYIKFDLSGFTGEPKLVIPDLKVEKLLLKTDDLGAVPFFKMKKEGVFPFILGSLSGSIEVVEYIQPNYEAVTAQRAQEIMKSFSPVLLDVRTPMEFKSGHLADAKLIPVQLLQARAGELAGLEHEPILIYCATGNRSTVASKILIDKGFTRIFNLRYGIKDWTKKDLPTVK